MVGPSAAVVSESPAGRSWVILIVTLVAALVFLGADTAGRVAHLWELRAQNDIHVPAPALSSQSPTGYAGNERTLVLPKVTVDTYHEIIQAQQMLANGYWRIRRVDYDNAPEGREVHWSIPMRTWLALLAVLQNVISGRPLGAAVEDAAMVANPLLLAIFIAGSGLWLARRFGITAGALLVAGSVCFFPFYFNFAAGNAEHQGLAEASAFLTVVLLLRGVIAREKRAFVASGIAGGVGLWISTASEAPVLLGLGIGAILAEMIGNRAPRNGTLQRATDAGLWRWWGIVGASTSLAAYALEYFPAHLGWRFEVNHPIYAVAWAAGAEGICRCVRCARRDEQKADLRVAMGAGAIVGVVALAIFVTRRENFWVADPFLWKLHHDYIGEFQSLPWYFAQTGFSLATISGCLPLLLPFIALVFGLRNRGDRKLVAATVLVLIPATFATGLAVMQNRWWGLADGLAMATAMPMLAHGLEPPRRVWRYLCATLCFILLFPGAIVALGRLPMNRTYQQENIENLATRDLAHWLRAGAGARKVVVLSTPTLTTELVYQGNIVGIGTLYWENRAGLYKAAQIYAARTPDEARVLLTAAGATHIIAASWDPFMGNYIRLARGLGRAAPLDEPHFASCLVGRAPLPSWLHRIPFSLPSSPALARQSVLIFEIDAGGTPAERRN